MAEKYFSDTILVYLDSILDNLSMQVNLRDAAWYANGYAVQHAKEYACKRKCPAGRHGDCRCDKCRLADMWYDNWMKCLNFIHNTMLHLHVQLQQEFAESPYTEYEMYLRMTDE